MTYCTTSWWYSLLRKSAIPLALVGLVNLILFCLITGGRILNPAFNEWLMWGDSAQHYLGWEFFRFGPKRVWPPGLSPEFGLGYSSSIVYSDAIPLLAIPLKFILAPLTTPFQFLGIWVLTCLLLQGAVGLAILRRLNIPQGLAMPLTLFYSTAPAFLYRLVTGGHGHIALLSHFIVLAAILFCLQQQPGHGRWALLMGLAVLIQFYLVVMVVAIYLGSFAHVLVTSTKDRASLLRCWVKRWLPAQLLGLTALMYVAGYFVGASPSDEGFGIFRADLLTFVDPNPVDMCCYSRILPDLALSDGSHEGFAFLGVGVILSLFVIPVFFMRDILVHIKSFTPVLLSAIPLMMLGMSNRLQFAGREIFEVPLTNQMAQVFGVVRSSGRFVWPLMYVAISLACVALGLLYLRSRVLGLVITFSLVFAQIGDSFSAMRETRERFTESSREQILVSTRWSVVTQGKTCLITSPVQFKGKLWVDLAEVAIRSKMSTNVSYQSRWDQERTQYLSEQISDDIRAGTISPDCLYVLIDPLSPSEYHKLKMTRTPKGSSYAVEVIDGFTTIAVMNP